MNNKQYWLELLKNGYWIFPIRGKGKTVEDAKKPMTFKDGDKLITWKSEEILGYAEEMARKNHNAFGLWLLKSNLFGVDIDLYSANDPDIEKKILDFVNRHPEFYSERSGRGGIHIVTGASKDILISMKSSYEWLQYKHDGYFIVYPSELRTPEGVFRYEKIAGDIIHCGWYEDLLTLLKNEIDSSLEFNVLSGSSSGSIAGKFNFIRESLLKLKISKDQFNDLLIFLLKYAKCGLMNAVIQIKESKVIDLPWELHTYMKIPRSWRFHLQHQLASILYIVGAKPSDIEEWLYSWNFSTNEDIDHNEERIRNVLYNISRGTFSLIPKGTCPFGILYGCNCNSTPFFRVLTILKNGFIRKALVEYYGAYEGVAV